MAYQLMASSSKSSPPELTVNAFYRCDKNVASYPFFGRNAPVFTNAIATTRILYSFFMSGAPKGYKVVGFTKKTFGFFNPKLNPEELKALKRKIRLLQKQAFSVPRKAKEEEITSGQGKRAIKAGAAESASAKKKKQDEVEKEEEEMKTDSEATEVDEMEDDEDSDQSAANKESKMATTINTVDDWFPTPVMGNIRLITAVLLLPGSDTEKCKDKTSALVFASEGALYHLTLSVLKCETLANKEIISAAFGAEPDNPIGVNFGKAAALDPATLTVYIKGVIRTEESTYHEIITYQMENCKDAVASGSGKWGRLKFGACSNFEGEGDPNQMLKCAKFIAFYGRSLYVMLKTSVEENYPRLCTCYKIMIISLDDGNNWRTVDTTTLYNNEFLPLKAQHKFTWAQRATESNTKCSSQLLCMFTRFGEGETEDERRSKAVNSIWSFDLETFQWQCLNSGRGVLDKNAAYKNWDSKLQLIKVGNPGLDRLTMTCSSEELWILPQSKYDVAIDKKGSKKPLKTVIYCVPLAPINPVSLV